MGYTTEFDGRFALDRKLAPVHAAYLRKFAGTRRMRRDAERAAELADPVRIAAGLPIGTDGCYFVGGLGFYGQDDDASVDRFKNNAHNEPPADQPGLWCHWEPTEDDLGIAWNGTEKFYDYVEWLAYLIGHFLRPWGYDISGSVKWQGEDINDRGIITIVDGVPAAQRLA